MYVMYIRTNLLPLMLQFAGHFCHPNYRFSEREWEVCVCVCARVCVLLQQQRKNNTSSPVVVANYRFSERGCEVWVCGCVCVTTTEEEQH